MKNLKPGDRVRLSRKGISHMEYQAEARYPGRKGIVLPSRGPWIRVRWDGRKTTASYHQDFITRVKP